MIYKFRMISNEINEFFRDFELKDDQNFYDFHRAIQLELDYDENQMASFFLTNENWGKIEEISLFEMTDPDDGTSNSITMDQSIISEYINEIGQQLLYEFDFFLERAYFIKLVDIYEEEPLLEYPLCLDRRGEPPDQIIIKNNYTGDILPDG